MAFVYEKIREEDKEWVDFGQFKGIWRNPIFSKWLVDRDNLSALILMDKGGRLGEDDYEVHACGFYKNKTYVNFTLNYQETKENGQRVGRWYEPLFSNQYESEHQKQEFLNYIREAFLVYITDVKVNKSIMDF